MSLEEVPNEYSNFAIYSVKNSKDLGEPILYSDQVTIRNMMNKQYWININKIKNNPLQYNSGLEINASENNSAFKICCYMDFKTYIVFFF